MNKNVLTTRKLCFQTDIRYERKQYENCTSTVAKQCTSTDFHVFVVSTSFGFITVSQAC